MLYLSANHTFYLHSLDLEHGRATTVQCSTKKDFASWLCKFKERGPAAQLWSQVKVLWSLPVLAGEVPNSCASSMHRHPVLGPMQQSTWIHADLEVTVLMHTKARQGRDQLLHAAAPVTSQRAERARGRLQSPAVSTCYENPGYFILCTVP